MRSEFYLFHVGPVPVSASIWFFVLVAFMVSGEDLAYGAMWAAVVTVSILVHELGHAAVAQHYRLQPRILLHGIGGLCAHDRADTDKQDAFIIAAGPGAGLALGALSFAVGALLLVVNPGLFETYPRLAELYMMLLFVNIFWSFVNLLPMFPLDGGQLFRLGMLKVFKSPAQAEKVTHAVGIAVALAAIVAAVMLGAMFGAIIGLMILGANVQGLRSTRASGAIRSRHTHAHALVVEAEQAMSGGDFLEAARLGHQLRSLPNVPDVLADKAMELIAVGSLAAGKVDEGLRFAGYATPTPRLAAGVVQALLKRGLSEEAAEWQATTAYQALPQPTRDQLEHAPY